MKATAVFFGSTDGNTKDAAQAISKQLGAELFDVADQPADKLADFGNLVFGCPTWGLGELQEDWETFIDDLKDADLSGKKVAFFGFGDAEGYPDTFVDALGIIYNAIKDKGIELVGAVPTDGYTFDESVAQLDDKFVGLPLDNDNEANLTDSRIEKWITQLKAELN